MRMQVEDEIDDQEWVSLLNILLLSNGKNGLQDDRLYLDNCLMVTAVKNKKLLKDLKDGKQNLNVSCNAGVTNTN